MHSSLILSIPLIAHAGDLAGELGQVLVGAALVMADDFHQTLAHIDQAVVSGAGAHIGFSAGLDDFLRVAGLGAGGAAIADDPDSAVVGRVGLVAFRPQFSAQWAATASSPWLTKTNFGFSSKACSQAARPSLSAWPESPLSCRMLALTCTGSPNSLTSCAPLTSALPNVPGLW